MRFFPGCARVLLLISGGVHTQSQQPGVASYLRDLPFPAPDIRLPVFPDRVVSIAEHGAVGDRAETKTVLSVEGETSGEIRLVGMDLGSRKKPVILGSGMRPDAVVMHQEEH